MKWLALPESIAQFTEHMLAQLDFVREARNLDRFRAHFANNTNVSFPVPVEPYVSERVLVESWEDGVPLTEAVHVIDEKTKKVRLFTL